MTEHCRPTIAQIDLSAVRHNIAFIRERIIAGCMVMAVVKSDAYGHGMIPVARCALQAGARALGVATSDEALTLRDVGGFETTPILVMGPTTPDEAEALQKADIGVAIGTNAQLRHHLRVARRLGRHARLHIQIDTGMGREGYRYDDLSFLDEVNGNEASIEGLFTHFSVADGIERDEVEFTNLQCSRFDVVRAAAIRASLDVICHAANSGAILRHPRAHYDMVRPGIMMYGCEPNDMPHLCQELHQVMSLRSRIVTIRSMQTGDTISYGRRYVMPSDGPIGIVPIGYGDGYPRDLSNKGHVLVRGVRVPIRGTVCMDQIMIDLQDVPDAAVGDEVVLYGMQDGGEISIEDVARETGTISYEITCRVTRRVPRVYTDR